MPESRRKTERTNAAAPRECGSCSVCCTAMHVAALDKPAGQPCEHQGEAACGGCGIYERRPSVCRNWYCMWVRDNGKVFSDDERPDKLGVFFTAGERLRTESTRLAGITTQIDETDEQIIYAHPIRPGGERDIASRVVIARFRRFFPVHILPYRGPSAAGSASSTVTQLTSEGRAIEPANST